jgi:hypothetical protein
MKEAKIIFHGGCLGCLTQNKKGIDFCRKCKYFDADWSLPDLSERVPTSAELERIRIKRKYGMDRYETKNRS